MDAWRFTDRDSHSYVAVFVGYQSWEGQVEPEIRNQSSRWKLARIGLRCLSSCHVCAEKEHSGIFAVLMWWWDPSERSFAILLLLLPQSYSVLTSLSDVKVGSVTDAAWIRIVICHLPLPMSMFYAQIPLVVLMVPVLRILPLIVFWLWMVVI